MAKRKSPVSYDDSFSHPAVNYRPPVKLHLIRSALVLLLSTSLVVALWVAMWFISAGQLRGTVNAWVDAQRLNGWQVDYTAFELGGFPVDLTLTINNPRIRAPENSLPAWAQTWLALRGAWSWQGEQLKLFTRPWWPWRVVATLDGSHRISLPLSGYDVAYQGNVEALSLDVSFTDGEVESADVDIKELMLTSSVEGQDVRADSAQVQFSRELDFEADTDDETFGLRVDAHNIVTPGFYRLPLGKTFPRVDVDMRVKGGIKGKDWPTALAVWRDHGGVVDVRRLKLAHGPLTLDTNGIIALDEAMQPVGSFTAQIGGFFHTLDALRDARLLRDRSVVTAKVVLGALSQRRDNGDVRLNLPLTIKAQQLYLGPVAVATLSELDWADFQAKTVGR